MTTTGERPIGPEAGFKDYVRYRKAQGFNWVNIIAAFPNWMTDGQPWHVVMNDPERTTVRSAWLEFGTGSAKNMDNEGGRPFLFPGKVPGYENMFPDVDRVNPEYFHYLDRKIDYLNDQGFVPFIEVSRRDASLLLEEVLPVARLLRALHRVYLRRYQANNTVLSPIHLDIISESVGPDDFTRAIKHGRWRSTGRRHSARCFRPTPIPPRWKTGATIPGSRCTRPATCASTTTTGT